MQPSFVVRQCQTYLSVPMDLFGDSDNWPGPIADWLRAGDASTHASSVGDIPTHFLLILLGIEVYT